MKFLEVKSSTIKAIAYENLEEGNGKLYVEFLSGHMYRFNNISNMQYLSFLNSKSKGKHFAETIKKFSEKHPAIKLSKDEIARIKNDDN